MDHQAHRESKARVTQLHPHHNIPHPHRPAHQLIHTQSQIMIIQRPFSDSNILQGIYCTLTSCKRVQSMVHLYTVLYSVHTICILFRQFSRKLLLSVSSVFVALGMALLGMAGKHLNG